MLRAYKAHRNLEYELSVGILGRKTAIHGSTIWDDCSVRWMSISLVISLSKGVRDY